MSRNTRPVVVKKGLDLWVMTYGDMMTLLLTFFVLIVSFSSIQEVQFKQAAMALREAFGVLKTPESVLELNHPIVPRHAPNEEAQLIYELREMERSLLAEGVEGEVQVEVTPMGIAIRMDAPVLFATGAAELKEGDGGVIARIGGLLAGYPHPIRVEGHTDSVPMRSARYPSNWHLSAARAVAVATRLQECGVAPERVGATGYGEHRPVADNASLEGRTRNRRVEIFVEFDPERAPRGGLPLVELERAPAPVRVEPTLATPVTERLGRLPVD
ncbi:MAG: OmpA family protein [Candidatus Krumholzibacteriia bacterium]